MSGLLDRVPVVDVDPFSGAFFDDPFPAHAAMRDAGPVFRLSTIGTWGVARHAEVHAILNDHETYCSSRGVGLADLAREDSWRSVGLLLQRDPPEHTRARAVMSRVLSPGTIKRLRDGFAAAADAAVARVLEAGEVDAIPALAEAYPLSVFPDALGLPREGREHLLPYASLAFNAFGPDNELRRGAMATAAPHAAWVMNSCRRENLAPDGLGAAIHAAAGRGEVTPEEAILLVRTLLTAGLDTTVNGLAAALHALSVHPGEFARLRVEPTLARAAFEEAVRLDSPVQTFFRTTTRNAEVGGTVIPEGEKVLLFLSAANRDPRRWENPDRYDLRRRTAGHVGFGSGIHVCVGALLARVEAEALLDALARRVAALEPAGPPVRQHNNTLRGLASLPLRVRG